MLVPTAALAIVILSVSFHCAHATDAHRRSLEQKLHEKSNPAFRPNIKSDAELLLTEPEKAELVESGDTPEQAKAELKTDLITSLKELLFIGSGRENVKSDFRKDETTSTKDMKTDSNTFIESSSGKVDGQVKVHDQPSTKLDENLHDNVGETKSDNPQTAETKLGSSDASVIPVTDSRTEQSHPTMPTAPATPNITPDLPLPSTKHTKDTKYTRLENMEEVLQRSGEIRTATGGLIHTFLVILTVFAFLSNGAFLVHVFWFSK